MADINHNTSPEIHQNHIDKPAIVKSAESLGVGPKTGKVIIDTKTGIASILVKGETKKETSELNEDFKKKFIEKLKKLPDYKGSKVQEAIEKGTVEIKKIPNRNGFAIYESKTGNLVYITRLDGTRYTNVDYFRTRPGYEDGLKGGYLRQGYTKIELDNGLWKLYNKNGKEIPISSNEYMTATLNAVNEMWDLADYIMNEAKKRRKKGEID